MRALAVRFTAVAIIAAVLLGLVGLATIQLATPSDRQVALVAVAAASEKKVQPSVRIRWWGFEPRLTKYQTQQAAILGGGAIAIGGVSGLAAPVVILLGTALASTAYHAEANDLCAGLNVPWPSIVPGNPMFGQWRAVQYKC